MTKRTRIVLPSAISGAIGALFGAVVWFFSNLPASPDPIVWQIALTSGATVIGVHIAITVGLHDPPGDNDDGGTPEIDADTIPQA